MTKTSRLKLARALDLMRLHGRCPRILFPGAEADPRFDPIDLQIAYAIKRRLDADPEDPEPR